LVYAWQLYIIGRRRKIMDEKQNPLEQAMDMAMKAQNAQFNAAKLVITWTEYGHTFSVESLNPVSAFELMAKVKTVAKKEFGSNMPPINTEFGKSPISSPIKKCGHLKGEECKCKKKG
jgi:hypothetical protein